MKLTWADKLRKEGLEIGQEMGVEKGVRQIADQILVARSLEEMGLR